MSCIIVDYIRLIVYLVDTPVGLASRRRREVCLKLVSHPIERLFIKTDQREFLVIDLGTR
jgi:hypothetical protein